MTFLGVSRIQGTERNPLDFSMREQLLRSDPYIAVLLKESVILPQHDQESDELWSANLDTAIRMVYPTGQITLYHSRDGFGKHYHGKFKVCNLYDDLPKIDISGTQLRKNVIKVPSNTEDFRKGVIFAQETQWP